MKLLNFMIFFFAVFCQHSHSGGSEASLSFSGVVTNKTMYSTDSLKVVVYSAMCEPDHWYRFNCSVRKKVVRVDKNGRFKVRAISRVKYIGILVELPNGGRYLGLDSRLPQFHRKSKDITIFRTKPAEARLRLSSGVNYTSWIKDIFGITVSVYRGTLTDFLDNEIIYDLDVSPQGVVQLPGFTGAYPSLGNNHSDTYYRLVVTSSGWGTGGYGVYSFYDQSVRGKLDTDSLSLFQFADLNDIDFNNSPTGKFQGALILHDLGRIIKNAISTHRFHIEGVCNHENKYLGQLKTHVEKSYTDSGIEIEVENTPVEGHCHKGYATIKRRFKLHKYLEDYDFVYAELELKFENISNVSMAGNIDYIGNLQPRTRVGHASSKRLD